MSEAALRTVCAWCGRIRSRTGEWRRADAREASPDDRATHGICHDCLERTAGLGERAMAQ